MRRGIGRLRAGGSVNPIPALFAAGEQGGWWDASDFSTMFQDSAGTTPVTAVGQPVGKINDKSGRGNHLIQATAASRPVLRQDGSGYYYLEIDGVDDGLVTAAAVDFGATQKATVFSGIYTNNTTAGIVVELTADASSNIGGFNQAVAALSSGDDFISLHPGTVAQAYTATKTTPRSAVVTGSFDTSAAAGSKTALRVNGVAPAVTVVGGAGTANLANANIYVGRRGGATLPFNGRIYQLVIRGAATSAADITNTERYVGGKMGIAL